VALGVKEGSGVGNDEGFVDGETLGCILSEGVALGVKEGNDEGIVDGVALGSFDGLVEGVALGKSEGNDEGSVDGVALGSFDGLVEGVALGKSEGNDEGSVDGVALGSFDGLAEGVALGEREGNDEGLEKAKETTKALGSFKLGENEGDVVGGHVDSLPPFPPALPLPLLIPFLSLHDPFVKLSCLVLSFPCLRSLVRKRRSRSLPT
jgi:flagellar biosynthesis/type III secretory pathway protein FliH